MSYTIRRINISRRDGTGLMSAEIIKFQLREVCYMPKYDGTGPMGKGSMTGKGKGYCIIPLDDNYNFDSANSVDNNMPTPNAFSNDDFQKRRLFPYGIIGKGQGRGRCNQR